MANPLDIALHTSAAEIASGVGPAVDISPGLPAAAQRSCVRLLLEVTAVAGTTPSITVTIETSPSNTGAWRALGSFDPLNAVGTFPRMTFATCERYVRARWTISGTGGTSFTFALSGSAHVLYASPDDVARTALPPKALTSVDAATQADACLAGTDEADGYLSGRLQLPLVGWGADLTLHVANLAAFIMMKRRGFQPGGADELIVKGRDDSVAWLSKINANKFGPQSMTDQNTPETGLADSFVCGPAVTMFGPGDY